MAPANDPREVLNRHSEPPDLALRYAAHTDGLIDAFLPPSLGRPARPGRLVFLVHGGFWRQEYDRLHVRPLANALAQRGFVVAVPEYRRGDGGWPDTGHDVEAALAAAPGLIQAAAPGRVDPAAPGTVIGHSAGGHLAMWAGLRAGPARVRSVVVLAPVSDLAYAAESGMGDQAAQDLLGGGPADVPDRYAEADAIALLRPDVPVTIFQGTDDRQVTVEMNRAVAADRGPGSGLTYVELPGVEHFALIDPLAPVFESFVLPAVAG